jgi:hypothetical protein
VYFCLSKVISYCPVNTTISILYVWSIFHAHSCCYRTINSNTCSKAVHRGRMSLQFNLRLHYRVHPCIPLPRPPNLRVYTYFRTILVLSSHYRHPRDQSWHHASGSTPVPQPKKNLYLFILSTIVPNAAQTHPSSFIQFNIIW